jgi:hypothetical protein
MKQLTLIILLSLGCSLPILSQAPQGFNYQAVIRDGNGEILENANVTIKFTIQISDSPLHVNQISRNTNFGYYRIWYGQLCDWKRNRSIG